MHKKQTTKQAAPSDGTTLLNTATTAANSNNNINSRKGGGAHNNQSANMIDELTSRLAGMELLRAGAAVKDEEDELAKALSTVSIDTEKPPKPPAIGRRGTGAAFSVGDAVNRSNVRQKVYKGGSLSVHKRMKGVRGSEGSTCR